MLAAASLMFLAVEVAVMVAVVNVVDQRVIDHLLVCYILMRELHGPRFGPSRTLTAFATCLNACARRNSNPGHKHGSLDTAAISAPMDAMHRAVKQTNAEHHRRGFKGRRVRVRRVAHMKAFELQHACSMEISTCKKACVTATAQLVP